MDMRRFLAFLCVLMATVCMKARDRQSFDAGWLFALADSAQMATTEYNDSWWRKLDVPHD